MSRYADPTRCPNCGSYASGTQRCVRCGLLLLGPKPELLIRILGEADRVLDELRTEAFSRHYAQRAAVGVGTLAPPSPPRTPYPTATPRPATTRRRTWTVASTLLALGALCLVVAAFVFVSVSWGALGLLGRTTVLVAVTAIVGACGAIVTKRRLRGSAEALWSVFLAMLLVDYLGARTYGLFGMAAWPTDRVALVLGALLLVAATAIGSLGLRTVGLRLWVADIGAGIGCTVALAALAESVPVGTFWTAAVCVVTALCIAVALHGAGLRYATWYASGLAILAQFAAISAAIGDTFAQAGARALIMHDGTAHTVVASAMTYLLGAVAYALLRRRGSADAPLVASATTATAATPALALAYAPASESVVGTHVVAAVVLAVLAVVGIAARGPWSRGIRVTAAIAVVPPLALAAGWIGTAASTVVATLSPVWSADTWVRMDPVDSAFGPVWLAPIVFSSLALALGAVGWYVDLPGIKRVSTHVRWSAVWCALGGMLATVCLLSPPVLVVALIALGAGVFTVGVAHRISGELAGIAVIVGASAVPLASPGASVAVWSAVIVCTAAIAVARHGVVAYVATGLAAAYLHVTAVGVADIAGADGKVLQLSLIGCVVGVALAAQLLRTQAARQAAEGVAATFGILALVAGTTLPLGWQSAMFTTLGATCALIALVRVDRRMLAVVGGALTGVGYVLRLVASRVDVLEAYTLPLGVILLAVGYLAMRRSEHRRTSAALFPGLAMTLVPSLPAVLVDPTTLRGLLLGLGAVTVLGIGARMKWQAPFVSGAALVALLTVRHIGPYADAVPRWGLIALAGTVMLVIGVTWESRVREARSLASFVGAMR